MAVSIEIFDQLKQLTPILKKEYGVKEIGVFGLFSDGTQTAESDIDLLVELEKPIGWKFFGLEIFLEKSLERKIDLVTKNALKEQLRAEILSAVVPTY